ncbi:MAG: MarR family transcriptional regulator [Clostridiaceae bacterium]
MDINILNEAGENIFEMTMAFKTKFFNPHSLSKSCEVPPSQIRVLFYLKGHGENTMSILAKHLHISKPNLTPIIDKLLEDGYVERNASSKDRRILIISLSEKGWVFLNELNKTIIENFKERIKSLSDEEIVILNDSAKHFLEIMKKI